MSIKEYISQEYIPLGRSKRFDCPTCGGTNTLSVTNFGDCIKYYCFHSECTKGGVIKAGLSEHSFSEDSRSFVNTNFNLGIEHHEKFWRLDLDIKQLKYLQDNHCLKAWRSDRADIRYDFKKNRMVFVVKEDGVVVDAAGRALGNELPKWYRYGKSNVPFICGDFDTAVLVEDCASAVAVSSYATGVAMMGTSLSEECANRLTSYKKVIVAVDEDATDKAVNISHTLQWNMEDVQIRVLPRDLKRLDEIEAKRILRLDD